MNAENVCLNGKIVPASEAKVSVLDRGFLYGDAAFTTMRAYGGKLAHLSDHFRRLEGNLASLGIAPPASEKELLEATLALLEKNDLGKSDAIVRVQISRGVGDKLGLKEEIKSTATLLILAYAIDEATLKRREQGISLVCVEGLHGGGASKLKLSFYAKNLLCAREAKARGADDGVFLDVRGYLAEASTANFFFVKKGKVHTPSLDVGALPGITRGHVLALCRREGIPAEEGLYKAADVERAEEVFVTGSVSEIVPAHHFEGKAVRDFQNRPLTRKLQDLYSRFTREKLSP